MSATGPCSRSSSSGPSSGSADAERAGHERLAEINRPDVLNLRRIIAGLDRLAE